MCGSARFKEVNNDSDTSISSSSSDEHKDGQEDVFVSKFAVSVINEFPKFILSLIEFVDLNHSLIIASSDLDSLSEMSVPMFLLGLNQDIGPLHGLTHLLLRIGLTSNLRALWSINAIVLFLVNFSLMLILEILFDVLIQILHGSFSSIEFIRVITSD